MIDPRVEGCYFASFLTQGILMDIKINEGVAYQA